MPVLNWTSKARYQEAWTSPETFATSLLLLLVDNYGAEATAWDSQTIRLEIEDDFKVQLPQPNFDRLMVAINLLTTDDFFRSLPDFISFCNILSGDIYDPRIFDPADAEEIAWGITEALLIEPPDTDEPFTDEVRAYIGAALDAEGIINPPDVLRIALRTTNLGQSIHTEFSDDPEMFGMIYDLEAEKTAAINGHVKARLRQLYAQLEALPLRVGDATNITEKIMSAL